MPKYAPYGLTEEDLHEPHEKVMPERVQKLIELHHKNKIEYNWTEEDRNEQKLEYRKGLKPASYTYVLEAIYKPVKIPMTSRRNTIIPKER